MDYRQIYRDKNGVIWAVTDYGLHRLSHRQRTTRRRQWLMIGIGLVALNVALICIVGYTMWGLRHG